MTQLKDYNLKENPFDIFSHRHKMANRKDEWEKITRCLSSAFKEKYPRIFILTGDYGCGKTYMLEQIFTWVSESKETARAVFVIYISPGAQVMFGPRLSIMETEPRWQKFGLSLITRIFDNIGRTKLAKALKKIPVKKIEKLEFGKVFEGLRNSEEVAFNWVSGKKLTAKELKTLGVSSNLSDSPTGLKLFFDFLKAIRMAGYASFLLLLDEFEYIPSILGEKKITQILNTFREIFDSFGMHEDLEPGMYANPIFIFAASPGGWTRLEKLEKDALKKTGGGGIAPFMERINKKDIIDLKPFSLDKTMELVKLRLSEVRVKPMNDPFFPFTEDCIKYIHEASLNKPRNVIQYCKILIEDALEKEIKRIDVKKAKSILDGYGISSESEAV